MVGKILEISFTGDFGYMRFHDFRHSFATRCIDCGMDIKSLSEILGHANVQVTLQMYVHPFMDSKRSALEAASVLSGILVGTE